MTLACEVVDGTRDPCSNLDPPMRCVVAEGTTIGTCQACGQVEFCNDIDDDCDGEIDELDNDGDNVPVCPRPGQLFDCDDNQPSAFPRRDGNPFDPCDGIDNDCDPNTPDGSTECTDGYVCTPAGVCEEITCLTEGCPSGEFCDQTTSPPECAPLDTSCFNIACESPERCNPRTGTCVAPQPNGTPCDGSAECMSDLCVPGPSIRAEVELHGRGGVCGTTCCTDTDCAADFICWASGSGLRACVPRTLFADAPHPEPAVSHCSGRTQCGDDDCVLGQDDAWTVESRASMACRSTTVPRQRCDNSFQCDLFSACLDGICTGTCFRGSDCPSRICLGGRVGTCSLSPDECTSSDQCRTLCLGQARGRCADTCGSSEECPVGEDVAGADNPSCVFVDARVSSSGRDDVVTLCTYSTTSANEQGVACSDHGECRDRTCVDADGRDTGDERFCSDTCCTDRACGADEQCRPVEIRGHWETHCLPRPTFPVLGTPPT